VGECIYEIENESENCITYPDNDSDGYTADVDCNDSNPDINPGADEVCDGVDNDCDEETDEGVMNTYYFDDDNDKYGDPENSIEACWPPEGYISDNRDCNDRNRNINPSVSEVCDGLDNNCDGRTDEVCFTRGAGGGGGPLCLPAWECSNWTDCTNGSQTRICEDDNNCNTDHDKPAETQDCDVSEEETQPSEPGDFVCVEGSRMCVNDTISECIQNSWIRLGECETGCESGSCLSFSPEEPDTIDTGGLVGFISANPAAFWGLIILLISIVGSAVYVRTRPSGKK
jgi:hypothetical protein